MAHVTFWSGSMDVRCPLHEGRPRFMIYPDVAVTREGHDGVTELFATCPCGTTAWIRPSATDGRPFAACIMPNRSVKVRSAH